MGVTRGVQCLWAISSWKSEYSSSLSWTCLSLWKDHPLMASKCCWCSALRKRWLSNSEAAREPSPVVSLLDLFVKSFFGAISCEKNNTREVSSRNLTKTKARSSKNSVPFFPTKREYPHEFLKENLRINARFFLGYTYIYTYLSFGERYFMRRIYFRLQRNFLCYMPNYPTYIFCEAFLLPIYYSILNDIFAICSHFIHTYVHTLERQLHAIYSHIFTFIWKATSCCTFIGKAIFVLLIHIF